MTGKLNIPTKAVMPQMMKKKNAYTMEVNAIIPQLSGRPAML